MLTCDDFNGNTLRPPGSFAETETQSEKGLYLRICQGSKLPLWRLELGSGEDIGFGLLQVTRLRFLLDLPRVMGKLRPVYQMILSDYPNGKLPLFLMVSIYFSG